MAFEALTKVEHGRQIRQAAWVACFIAVATVVGAVFVTDLGPAERAVVVSIGLVQLALAYGIRRGSRACAVAVLALFVLDRLITFAVDGISFALLLWTVIFGAMLVGGVRAAYAEHARTASAAGGAR